MISKYDLFWDSNFKAGFLIEKINEKFGKWGTFHIDNLEVLFLLEKLEKVNPTLAAITWLNESTYRFYSESNTNHSDDFNKWDTGPFQMNVGILKANIDRNYISIAGLSLDKITGTKAPLFNGDPIENGRAASRLLIRGGSQEIIQEVRGVKSVMFPKLTQDQWKALPEPEKNERRAVVFTGPAARPSRLKSWREFSPMFDKFFDNYRKG